MYVKRLDVVRPDQLNVVIIASDGLWDAVDFDTAIAICNKHFMEQPGDKQWSQAAAIELVEIVKQISEDGHENGDFVKQTKSNDDVTVWIIPIWQHMTTGLESHIEPPAAMAMAGEAATAVELSNASCMAEATVTACATNSGPYITPVVCQLRERANSLVAARPLACNCCSFQVNIENDVEKLTEEPCRPKSLTKRGLACVMQWISTVLFLKAALYICYWGK